MAMVATVATVEAMKEITDMVATMARVEATKETADMAIITMMYLDTVTSLIGSILRLITMTLSSLGLAMTSTAAMAATPAEVFNMKEVA